LPKEVQQKQINALQAVPISSIYQPSLFPFAPMWQDKGNSRISFLSINLAQSNSSRESEIPSRQIYIQTSAFNPFETSPGLMFYNSPLFQQFNNRMPLMSPAYYS
jgi:hypothetical protein